MDILLTPFHYQLPVVAYVPVPYDEVTRRITQVTETIVAHDTRTTASHPLRHAVLNLVRNVADNRAKMAITCTTPALTTQTEPYVASTASDDHPESIPDTNNGAHYLLTSLTVFLSHEPCIMCSMALLHSRVKEIFYLYPMEKTGGCGGAACLMLQVN